MITRAQYHSSVTTTDPDTIIITVSKLIDCNKLGSIKPSLIFEIYEEGGKNTNILNYATIIGGCSSKYTSTVTMTVKNNALVTPSNDSIAFLGGTDAVIDQSGNKPPVNNKAAKFEWGIKNKISIGISSNPFTPGVTEIPTIIKQNYAEVIKGNASGIVISITSTNPLKSFSGDEYGKVIIYDAVANIVISDLPVTKITPQRYSIFWNGRNRNKRHVGGGAYLAVITISDNLGNVSVEKIKIGVRQ